MIVKDRVLFSCGDKDMIGFIWIVELGDDGLVVLLQKYRMSAHLYSGVASSIYNVTSVVVSAIMTLDATFMSIQPESYLNKI